MLPIYLTALVVAVAAASAQTTSIRSYAPSPSVSQDYAGGASSGSYVASASKPSYSAADLGAYYAKSDTSRYYTADNPTADSSDPRASLSPSSFYKTKYGSDAVVNSLRPSYPSSSSSSSSSSASSSASESASPNQATATHYSSVDYSHPDSGSGGFSGSHEYTPQSQHHHQQHHHHQQQQSIQEQPSPLQLSAADHYQYQQVSRPSSPIYGSSHYAPSRGLSSSVSSSLSVSDYPGVARPHHPAYSTQQQQQQQPGEYSAHPPSPYKTYLMSGPSLSSSSPIASLPPYASKYQSVFGAIKSLFGGGEPSVASAGPSPHYAAYASPSASGPSPSYYLGSGPSPSSSASYAKSLPSMRLVASPSGYAGYGGSSSGGPGGRVIVVRESTGAHSPSYPSSSSSGALIGSPPGYSLKGRISAFAPSASGHAGYMSAAPSSLSYASAPPHGYSSSGSSFGNGHGGSTFLGYSI